MIGGFKVAIKFFGFLDVVNIKVSITAAGVAAYLASVIVSFLCSALLPIPIWAIIIFMASVIIWVIFPSTIFAQSFIHTFAGAIVATTLVELVCSCLIFPATGLTDARDVDFWLSCGGLGLACRKLRTALRRTKTRLAISPLFKLLAAPFAGKDRMLGGITIYPSSYKPTFFRAEPSGRSPVFKLLSACFTDCRRCFCPGLVSMPNAAFS